MDRRVGAAARTGSPGPFVLLIAFGALVLALVAACTPGTSPSPSATATSIPTTGVRGIVLAGPTCPVERPGQSACVRPVSGATILALDSAGREVGRAASDAGGAYFLPLAPGSYRIVPQPVQGLMGVAPESTVTVPQGMPAQLDLEYDTGIR